YLNVDAALDAVRVELQAIKDEMTDELRRSTVQQHQHQHQRQQLEEQLPLSVSSVTNIDSQGGPYIVHAFTFSTSKHHYQQLQTMVGNFLKKKTALPPENGKNKKKKNTIPPTSIKFFCCVLLKLMRGKTNNNIAVARREF